MRRAQDGLEHMVQRDHARRRELGLAHIALQKAHAPARGQHAVEQEARERGLAHVPCAAKEDGWRGLKDGYICI